MPAQFITVTKETRTTGGTAANGTLTGFESSTWQLTGNPSHGAAPTTWANPTNATPGSLFQTDPVNQSWLTAMDATYCQTGRLVLYDRLGHMGGMLGNLNTVQQVNGGSPGTVTRHYLNPLGNTDDGNEIFLEIYTSTGNTPTTASVIYTNSAGLAGQVGSCAFGVVSGNLGQRIARVQLAPGDTGVQSVSSVQLAASVGAAGNFGVVIAHRLLELEISAAGGPERWSGADGGNKEIFPGACLAFTFLAGGTSSVVAWAMAAALTLGDF